MIALPFDPLARERPDLDAYKADGRWRNTCMVHGKRQAGGCAGWEEDREDMGAPTSRDVSTARAICRAQAAT